MSPLVRRAKRSSWRTRTAIGGLSILALALVLMWPLGASASHPPPTLPLVAPHVESISDCAPPAPDIGVSIPTGQVGNATTPPDRNNTSSSNEQTTGTIGTFVIHANAESDPKENTLDVSGSHNVFDGELDSRSHAKVSGSWNLFRHGFEYGQRSEPGKVAFDLTGSNNCFSPGPVQEYENAPPASPDGFPLEGAFDPDGDGNILEHFAPGTTAANAAMNDPFPGTQYFVCGIPDPDGAASGAAVAPGCAGSGASAIMDRNVQGQALERGLYFVTGRIKLSASNLNARITMVSGQQLNVNGSFQGQGVSVFTPYTDAGGAIFGTLLFASQWDEAAPLSGPTFPDGGTANDSPNTDKAEDALKIEGSLSRFEGINVATNGRAEISGEQLDFRCPVMGDRVRVNGSKNYFNATGCGRPGITVSKVPDGADADGLSGTVNAGSLAKFKITVTNSGTEPLTDIDLDDTLPGTVPPNWVENPDKTECTVSAGNDLHCDIPSLAVGASFSVTLERATTTADCAGDTGAGVKLDNGSLTADTSDDATATTGGLTATDPGHVIVRCPDVTVLKGPDEPNNDVNAGSQATFTVTFINNGPGPATGVGTNPPNHDVLPAGLTWAESGGDPANKCQVVSNVLSCSGIELAAPNAGNTDEYSVSVSATTSAANCGQLNNTVVITADGDTNPNNNTNAAEIDVICGALRIVKTAKHVGSGSANLVATFTIVDAAGTLRTLTTNASGVACIDGIAIGMTQSITETTVPQGYQAPTIANVNVPGGTCGANGALASGGVTVNVENKPLTDITIGINSQVPGATRTTVNCDNPATQVNPDFTFTTPASGDGTLSMPNFPVPPNVTLNCSIVIDP